MLVARACQESALLGLGGLERGRIPDGSEVFTDAFSDVVGGSMLHGILRQVALTALPRGRPECCASRRFQPRMVIRDDEGRATQSAGLQAFQERAPMHLGFAERHAEALCLSALIQPHPDA